VFAEVFASSRIGMYRKIFVYSRVYSADCVYDAPVVELTGGIYIIFSAIIANNAPYVYYLVNALSI
jgi:hypothetical protein